MSDMMDWNDERQRMEREKRQQPKVRRHRSFWMETPAGNDVRILGDPRMPAAAKRALGEMMDAVVKAYNEGKLPLPSNDKVSRPAGERKHD